MSEFPKANFKIEKGVPLPAKGKYPFARMEVGDSVFIPNKSPATVGGSVWYLKPKRFTARSVDGGVRVWRIE